MSVSKQYFIMFKAQEGGVVSTIPWDINAMNADNSIIIIDEENLLIWLWSGKRQSLIARRTAFRQAESLKGHGYTVGNTIFGRGLSKVVEIDERKIGKDPETDSQYKLLQSLLNSNFQDAGNNIVTKSGGSGGASKPPETKAEAPKMQAPKVEAAKPSPKVENVVQSPVLNKVSEPAPKAAAPPSDLALTGLFVMSTLEVFTDVFISKKATGYLAMENLDSLICEFKIEAGEPKFKEGSFEKIDASKKDDLLKKFKELKNK